MDTHSARFSVFFPVLVGSSVEVSVLSVELGSRRGLSVLLISIIGLLSVFFFFGISHTPSTHAGVSSGGGLFTTTWSTTI